MAAIQDPSQASKCCSSPQEGWRTGFIATALVTSVALVAIAWLVNAHVFTQLPELQLQIATYSAMCGGGIMLTVSLASLLFFRSLPRPPAVSADTSAVALISTGEVHASGRGDGSGGGETVLSPEGGAPALAVVDVDAQEGGSGGAEASPRGLGSRTSSVRGLPRRRGGGRALDRAGTFSGRSPQQRGGLAALAAGNTSAGGAAEAILEGDGSPDTSGRMSPVGARRHGAHDEGWGEDSESIAFGQSVGGGDDDDDVASFHSDDASDMSGELSDLSD